MFTLNFTLIPPIKIKKQFRQNYPSYFTTYVLNVHRLNLCDRHVITYFNNSFIQETPSILLTSEIVRDKISNLHSLMYWRDSLNIHHSWNNVFGFENCPWYLYNMVYVTPFSKNRSVRILEPTSPIFTLQIWQKKNANLWRAPNFWLAMDSKQLFLLFVIKF